MKKHQGKSELCSNSCAVDVEARDRLRLDKTSSFQLNLMANQSTKLTTMAPKFVAQLNLIALGSLEALNIWNKKSAKRAILAPILSFCCVDIFFEASK